MRNFSDAILNEEKIKCGVCQILNREYNSYAIVKLLIEFKRTH